MKEFPIRAAAFGRDEDLNTEFLVLAEQEDGGGRRIEVQRSLELDEQDRELGMDTYCLVDEDGATHYGGIREWSLRDRDVQITLTPEAADVLGADDGYLLHLQGPGAPVGVVATGLAALVGQS